MVKVSEMMAAIVQEQDVDGTIKALSKMDVPVTRLASSGGFLGRKNSTLLIGVGLAVYAAQKVRASNATAVLPASKAEEAEAAKE